MAVGLAAQKGKSAPKGTFTLHQNSIDEETAQTPYQHQEFPRAAYKAGEEEKRLENEAQKVAALADGWSLTPINGAVIDFDESKPAAKKAAKDK